MTVVPPQVPNAIADRSRLPVVILVVLMVSGCLFILRPFVNPLIWAAILAYVSWPAYRIIRRRFPGFKNATALGMTALLTCTLIIPVLWLTYLVSAELISSYQLLTSTLAQNTIVVPDLVRKIPWLGDQIQQFLDRLALEPAALSRQITNWFQARSSQITDIVGGLGRGIGELFVVIFTVFFFYRDGDFLRKQGQMLIQRVFGNRLDSYFATAGAMTRAVLFGFLTTAFAQGLIAGIGYAILGIRGAVLLGALTGILSVVPLVGTAIVWGSLSAYLLIAGHLWKGIILLAWGALLVHPTDNVLRPLLISNATHVPFLIVMFGVIGGITTLGLVGVFVGPVVLAIGLAIWRNWATMGGISASHITDAEGNSDAT